VGAYQGVKIMNAKTPTHTTYTHSHTQTHTYTHTYTHVREVLFVARIRKVLFDLLIQASLHVVIEFGFDFLFRNSFYTFGQHMSYIFGKNCSPYKCLSTEGKGMERGEGARINGYPEKRRGKLRERPCAREKEGRESERRKVSGRESEPERGLRGRGRDAIRQGW
jgi:hypothetical protein